MTKEQPGLCHATVYLKGDDLRPEEISKLVRLEPTDAHYKGKEWITSSKKKIVEKTGLWSWGHVAHTDNAGSALTEFLLMLPKGVTFSALPGVQSAYIDFLVVSNSDGFGGGECEFVIDAQSLHRLADLGLPLQITSVVIAGEQQSARVDKQQ